jgi:hypothetical protein
MPSHRGRLNLPTPFRLVAQWIEHQASNLRVGGSSPSEPATFSDFRPVLANFPQQNGAPRVGLLGGCRMDAAMPDWEHEPRIDPVVWATALFGIVAAVILAAAI